MAHHALFHQSIARAHGDAMAAAHTAGAVNLLAAVPHHARHLALPADGQRLVHLHVLAGLHAAPAQDALAGVVAIEWVGVILLVALGAELARLVLHIQLRRGVMHRAVAVVVVAHRAIEVVVFQDAVKGFTLGDIGAIARRLHDLACLHLRPTRANQLAVHLHQARVARPDGAHRRQIANLRNAGDPLDRSLAIDRVDQRFADLCRDPDAVYVDPCVRYERPWRVQQGLGMKLGVVHRTEIDAARRDHDKRRLLTERDTFHAVQILLRLRGLRLYRHIHPAGLSLHDQGQFTRAVLPHHDLFPVLVERVVRRIALLFETHLTRILHPQLVFALGEKRHGVSSALRIDTDTRDLFA